MSIQNTFRTLAVVTAQIVCFVGGWSLLSHVAWSHGRFPPMRFFEVTFASGAVFSIFMFVICGLVALLRRDAKLYWITILLLLVGWFLWLTPSFRERPVSLPAYYIFSSSLLIVGSGIILPRILLQHPSPHPTKGEQADAGSRDKPGPDP